MLRSLLVLAVVVFAPISRAATFSIGPTRITNDYTGMITLQMSGLSPGETVQVLEYFDRNTNGVVDAQDRCVRGDVLTDGQGNLIDGSTNINVLRDEDGATNGSITANLRYAFGSDLSHGAGPFFFRFISPSNNFTATNVSLTVVAVNYGQTIQGEVTNSGTNVPNAGIAVIRLSDNKVIVGALADATGNYSLSVPTGSYRMIAFQAGYVGNYLAFPTVTVAASSTQTVNLPLIAASSSLSGSLVDSANYSKHIIPGCQLLLFSTNLLISTVVADTNGNFVSAVTPNNVWTVRPSAQSAAAAGYLIADPNTEIHFSTFSGPVNNAQVPLQDGSALVYGSVHDNHGNPIGGLTLTASPDGGLYDAIAMTDTNGQYSMAVDQGGDFIEVAALTDAPASNYFFTGYYFSLANGQSVDVEITGYLPTARLRSYFTDDTGAPIKQLYVFADSDTGTTSGQTDNNGLLDIPIYAGTWMMHPSTADASLVFPDIPAFTIVDGVNFTNAVVARKVTGQITGYVHDNTNGPVFNLNISATASVSGTNFTLTATTDGNGNYAFNVFNTTWTLELNQGTLDFLGFQVPPDRVVPFPSTTVANFTLSPVPPPEILTTDLGDATVDDSYFGILTVTNGVAAFTWSVADGSLPDGLALNPAQGWIQGTPTNTGTYNFTIQVTDRKNEIATQQLSIVVHPQPTGPLQISTTYLNDLVANCAYSNQLAATGGALPYTWTLDPSSDPLPAGVNLNTNGVLTGIPASSGYASLIVRVTDALSTSVTGSVYVSVNDTLQPYPLALTSGTVGQDYVGSLYALGGGIITWTLISNSLPPNLSMDSSGNITGMVTNDGIYSFTVQATDGCTTFDEDASITNVYPLLITTAGLVAATNTPYSTQLQASGGRLPLTWSLVYNSYPLPDGLTLAADGTISGTPTTEGVTPITLEVQDADYRYDEETIDFVVAPPGPLLDEPQLAGKQFSFQVNGIANQSYTVQFATAFTNWADLVTTNSTDAVFIVTDPGATNKSRVYRVKVNP